mmetsp:Transcript_13060/g.30382  ORF Transcript_13060/g.30382 Transcript_13060/m.30382 type:complete len:271 (+) Transcript_13060:654-1466(+)|eukprot:CAMPEP_0116848140 /NCGR_PEP_ID=MMETSP0418-20121206/14827_1 /TAXON_ID=1158023 /ORGANISM="Astrosyne radiata, Strain 13vi08-1A" /LENGTH=270 /DNA_ID=CAMNT_0004479669 /DNA_START=199 /DNA_END=1011 /DNA_ORIENTATION=+
MDPVLELDVANIATNAFLAGSLLCLMSYNVPFLRGFLVHIKSKNQARDEYQEALESAFTLPKSYFLHFYIVGDLVATLMVMVLSDDESDTPAFYAASLLLLTHLTRRSLECLFLHIWRPSSKMHVLVYLGGLLHYVLVPIVMIQVSTNGREPNLAFVFAGTLICLYGQYEQYEHHAILAELGESTKEKKDGVYTIPSRRWFSGLACPHYFAETIIYAGFALILQTAPSVAMFGYVACNLSVAAILNHEYYIENVPGYAASGRRAIFPHFL